MKFNETRRRLVEQYLGETTSVTTAIITKLENKLMTVKAGLRNNDPCMVRDSVESATKLLNDLDLYANPITTTLMKEIKCVLKEVVKQVDAIDGGKGYTNMKIDGIEMFFYIDDSNKTGEYMDVTKALAQSLSKAGQISESEESDESDVLVEYDVAIKKWVELRNDVKAQCKSATNTTDGTIGKSLRSLSSKCSALIKDIDDKLNNVTPTEYVMTQILKGLSSMNVTVAEASGAISGPSSTWSNVEDTAKALTTYVEAFNRFIGEFGEQDGSGDVL